MEVCGSLLTLEVLSLVMPLKCFVSAVLGSSWSWLLLLLSAMSAMSAVSPWWSAASCGQSACVVDRVRVPYASEICVDVRNKTSTRSILFGILAAGVLSRKERIWCLLRKERLDLVRFVGPEMKKEGMALFSPWMLRRIW